MNILDNIVEVIKEEVISLKKVYSASSFGNFEFYNKECLRFYEALNDAISISIIAEIKKASPSKGVIRESFNHIEIAETYMKANVNAISVLTEEKFFKGSIKYLNDIASFKTVPLLRKDFIIDEIQIHQAKAFGADAILLISEILDKSRINDLTECAKSIGLSVLLELHSLSQLSKIDQSLNNIIGINNRNLEDFSVLLSTTSNIKKHLDKKVLVVSESGINTKNDVDFLKQINVNSILIGEHFMKDENIYESVNQMLQWCKL